MFVWDMISMNCLLLYIFLVLRIYILDLVELERHMDAVLL